MHNGGIMRKEYAESVISRVYEKNWEEPVERKPDYYICPHCGYTKAMLAVGGEDLRCPACKVMVSVYSYQINKA